MPQEALALASALSLAKTTPGPGASSPAAGSAAGVQACLSCTAAAHTSLGPNLDYLPLKSVDYTTPTAYVAPNRMVFFSHPSPGHPSQVQLIPAFGKSQCRQGQS